MNKQTTSNQERLVYVLWGHDTFSGESYICGVYRHRSSANRAMRKHEEDVKGQDPDLRDRFGVSVYTESYYLKMQMDEQKKIDAKSEIRTKNQAFVTNNASAILQKLNELAADKEFESYIKDNMGKSIDYDERPLVEVPDDMYIESIFLRTVERGINEYSFSLGIRTRDVPYADSDEMLLYLKRGTFDDFRRKVREYYTTEYICEALQKSIEKAIYDNS